MIPYRGKATIEKTIRYLENDYNYTVDPKDSNISSLKFRLTEEEISEILFNFAYNHMNISDLSMIVSFCELLNIIIGSNENKASLNNLFDIYIKDYKNESMDIEQLNKLFACFSDKKIPVEFLSYLYQNKKLENKEILKSFIDYLIKARQYYVDDRALLGAAINLVESIEESELMFGHEENIADKVNNKLKEDKKSNGIYDIDQTTLEELDRKMMEFDLITTKLEGFIEITETQIEELKKQTEVSKDDLLKTKIATLKKLKTESNKILSNFRNMYLEALNREKKSLSEEKDILLADIDTHFQKKKLELESLVSNVGQRIAIELGRIRNASDHSLEKIQDFVSNNEEIKKMFDIAKEDQAFMSRLAKMDAIPTPVISAAASTNVGTIAIPNIVIPQEERIVDDKVNYYFNSKIPFSDRFNELMEKKQEDIEKNGAIYHEKFDDLVTIVLMNDVPYMFGPSGCGKTFIIEKQLAKLFGINVVTNGYIMYESDILGFNNANGVYVPSNFYRCYKFGDMVFIDELDNSISSATIVLNSFIGKSDDSSYTFPDGKTINQHPNFRIVTAGNTRGNGRTVAHNTRQKIDEAVMQRLTPIEIDYDNRIEEKILENYPDWYNFSINFREALKNIRMNGSDGPNYSGTITTRDIKSIRDYKDNNSFTDEKILEYEVIENKNIDYLNQIIDELDRLECKGEFTEEGSVLLDKLKVLCKGRNY